AAWRLMVSAAVDGAKMQGYVMTRQPGRGMSNTWVAKKAGEQKRVSIRTSQDRWIAFPPLNNGARWKTLDEVDLVIVAGVDSADDPRNVEVCIFPAAEVRRRFDASYRARIAHGQTIRDDFGMWVRLDAPDVDLPSRIGSGLAVDYPSVARISIDEILRS